MTHSDVSNCLSLTEVESEFSAAFESHQIKHHYASVSCTTGGGISDCLDWVASLDVNEHDFVVV